MSELGAFFARNMAAVLIFDAAAIALVVYCIIKEEKLKDFEEKALRLIRHLVRHAVFSLKLKTYRIARRVFIKVYGAYRRHRIARCRRLARSVGCEIRRKGSHL